MEHVGVVVPVFNEVYYTKQFIHSLACQKLSDDFKLSLCIIDNNSTDETSQLTSQSIIELESEFDTSHILEAVHIIRNSENTGYGPACNAGLRYLNDLFQKQDVSVHGFLVCNNDMILNSDCIQNLIRCSDANPGSGIIGGRLLFPDGNTALWSVFGAVWLGDAQGWRTSRA